MGGPIFHIASRTSACVSVCVQLLRLCFCDAHTNTHTHTAQAPSPCCCIPLLLQRLQALSCGGLRVVGLRGGGVRLWG